MRLSSRLAVFMTALTASVGTAAGPPDSGGADPQPLLGHSAHGPTFDEGPRQRPWRMEGIGESHFPITTRVPEVQEWFDQGNTLLHNFWNFEAERSFRWCLKLDPDCAMAWWGLARATMDIGKESPRMTGFLREAVARKDQVTERERMYIEVWAKTFLPEWSDDPAATGMDRRALRGLARELEQIIIAFPDDDEAKALFVLASLFNDTRYGSEAVIRDILERHPVHPGAHHYRIHTWDGEQGAQALESCEIYGRLAWASGHASHMPGHIYSGIGMWHEAAIWMDSATRVEKRYMEQRMTLPFHNWNYAHNRNYLSFIQEQLGLPTLAIDGARQLLAAPLDPKYNKADGRESVHQEGKQALVRALMKFERWDAILDEEVVRWGASPDDQRLRAYCEAIVHLTRDDVVAAVEKRKALGEVKDGPPRFDSFGGGPPPPGSERKTPQELMMDELAGRIALARGMTMEGLRILSECAHAQWNTYEHQNDPPSMPVILYTYLGELYLEMDSPGQAAECFEKTLEVSHNDAFALSGLARARHALGEIDAARAAYGKLLFVWSDAESGLRWMDDARALGLDAEPTDDADRPQRNYASQTLDSLGPQRWEPYAAPRLDALDSKGQQVTLEEYRGKNVLLVFFLGESCVHCVDQLNAIGKRQHDFLSRDVELLAISSDTPEEHASSLKIGAVPLRLLSDKNHENARRFHSYDDFEEMELHSTIFIDTEGRIRWARSGGDPFMDVDFLLGEIDRVNGLSEEGAATASTRP